MGITLGLGIEAPLEQAWEEELRKALCNQGFPTFCYTSVLFCVFVDEPLITFPNVYIKGLA